MTVLTLVISVAFALGLLIFALAASRRRGGARAGGVGSTAWYSDGGAPHSDSGNGADCSNGSDGGGGCDGGGGGD